jgi:signal transduction histidine kinase
MTPATIPIEENERLSELYRYEILDTPREEDFDKITLLASRICRTPMSVISFVDRNRQWAKSLVGLKKLPADRNASFCSHAILTARLFEVRNALRDKRFADNPLVQQKPKIRFYAGMPLITSKGYKLGALCVIDTIPRRLTRMQTFALKVLSRQIVNLMELRMRNKQITQTAEMQQRIISIMSHDIRTPLSSIKTFIDLNKDGRFTKQEQQDLLFALSTNVSRTLQLLDNLVEWGKVQLQFAQKKQILKLKDLVNECIAQVELNILLKQNEIINEVEPDILVNADKEAVQFVLRNLISNANKFTDRGTIRISFFTDNDKCFLKVKDTGVGLEMDKISQILQDTGMYHTSGTRNEKGTGLGLSLIKSYLNKTGNCIEIKSKVNQGTSVSFSLCPVNELVPILA